MTLHPIDTPEQRRALAVRNRRILAERTGWPDGALQACEDFDARHPGWHCTWLEANTIKGWERPAGFSVRQNGETHGRNGIFRENIAALDAVFELTS